MESLARTAKRIPVPKRVRLRKKPKKLGEWRDIVSKSIEKCVSNISELEKGEYMWKVRRKKFRGVKWYKRKFRIDYKKLYIHYLPASNPISQKLYVVAPNKMFRMDMADIIEVRKGFSTDTFNEVQNKMKDTNNHSKFLKPDHSLSIIFDHRARRTKQIGSYTLDLVCSSQETRDKWFLALEQVLESMKEVEYQKEYELYLRRVFNTADKSKNGYLFLDEFAMLLRQINIFMDEAQIEKVFAEANVHKSEVESEQVLDEGEFIKFFHRLLERPDLDELFEIASCKYKGLAVTPYELSVFLQDTQGYKGMGEKECKDIITDYEIKDKDVLKKVKNLYMSWKGFLRFVMGSSLFHISVISKQITEDMHQPLSHYYINTSHNTYLVGNQVTSDSSIDGYIRALNAGCRCVELDCWDGPNGQPVIYHGWTLTSKLLLSDVLTDAIKPYAFKASPYPVILSIENHCNKEQQDVMATLFKDILGDMLYTTFVDKSKSELPSPEQLKNKILVKAKRIELKKSGSIDEPPETDALNHHETISKGKSFDMSTPSRPPRKKSGLRKSATIDQDNPADTSSTMSTLLSEVVNYCEAIKFKDFDQERKYWQMSSFDESKAEQFCTNETTAEKFAVYNSRNMSRIYPKGTRLDSSNLDPILPWSVGCQMVALNFQQGDKYNLYNRAKFQQNGGCGYVLKPKHLRENVTNPLVSSNKAVKLSVKLISGQHLPNVSDRQAGEIIEPYVRIRIVGHPEDTGDWESSSVPRNGFNPIWNEQTTFDIKVPELALVEFKVKSKAKLVGNTDDHLGSFCIPLSLLKQGYRNITLEDYEGKRLTPANLFIFTQIQP